MPLMDREKKFKKIAADILGDNFGLKKNKHRKKIKSNPLDYEHSHDKEDSEKSVNKFLGISKDG